MEVLCSVRRITTVSTAGKSSSCPNQHFSKGGKEEAFAGAKLAGADVAQEAPGPVTCARTGALWKEILGNFTAFL